MKIFLALCHLYGFVQLVNASTLGSSEVKILNPILDVVDRFTGAAGAVYFMTNHPDGNFIVTAALGKDGSVNFDRAMSTRGIGLHGINVPGSPDGTFSQGAVRVSPAGDVLAAVNPGSSTVSLFAINPRNPLDIDLVGQPVSSGGEFPISITFNTKGTAACVVNGGELSSVNCFKVDHTKGFVPIANSHRAINLNQTTPPSGPPGTASQVLFIENDSKLVVSIKGVPPVPGHLAVFDVHPDGSLAQTPIIVPPPKGGMLPFSMNVIPGQDAIFSTDAGVGFAVFDFSGLDRGRVTSPRSSITAIKGQMASCWSVFSSKTGNFYVVDVGTSTVTEVHVDKNLRTNIVKQYPQAKGASTMDSDVATLDGKDFMFILEADAASIGVLALKGPGNAQRVGSFNFSKLAKAAGLPLINDNVQGIATFVTRH